MALEDYDEAVELLQSSASSSKRGLVAAYGRETGHGGNGGTEFIREFGEMSLPAFESYVERMARTGDVGQWMRTLLPAYRARIAGHHVLFMHADLPEQYRDRQVLDDQLRWIEDYMKMSTVAVGGSRAKWANRRLADVVWGRTFSKLGSASQADIDKLCRKASVDYIVTGHTHTSIYQGLPQPDFRYRRGHDSGLRREYAAGARVQPGRHRGTCRRRHRAAFCEVRVAGRGRLRGLGLS